MNQVVGICILFQWFSAWLFPAPTEELMVHCSNSNPSLPLPVSLAAHHSLWPLLVWARPRPVWLLSVCVRMCVCSLCCVCHLYTCPPTCPQMPVCVADSLLVHACLEDDMFYFCNCDFNVSICLVQTKNNDYSPRARNTKDHFWFCTRHCWISLFFKLI